MKIDMSRSWGLFSVIVELWAFGENGKEIEVYFPKEANILRQAEDKYILEAAFKYGQNEFAVQDAWWNDRSICVGDLIHLRGKVWLILPKGFEDVTEVDVFENK